MRNFLARFALALVILAPGLSFADAGYSIASAVYAPSFSATATFQNAASACSYLFDVSQSSLPASAGGLPYVSYSVSGLSCSAVDNAGSALAIGTLSSVSTPGASSGASEGGLRAVEAELVSVREAVYSVLVASLGVVFSLGVLAGRLR